MKNLILYIHGKGGSPKEAEHYKPLFPEADVIGLDYKSQTPFEALSEFPSLFDNASKGYDKIYLIANSIGAFFSLYSLSDKRIEKAFFISPIVNMEKLICDMLMWVNLTEADLEELKEVETGFGETLSWDYLQKIRAHKAEWSTPAEILYGSTDTLQSIDTITMFADTFGAGITVMEGGEHWFHTDEQMLFLDSWIKSKK